MKTVFLLNASNSFHFWTYLNCCDLNFMISWRTHRLLANFNMPPGLESSYCACVELFLHSDTYIIRIMSEPLWAPVSIWLSVRNRPVNCDLFKVFSFPFEHRRYGKRSASLFPPAFIFCLSLLGFHRDAGHWFFLRLLLVLCLTLYRWE